VISFLSKRLVATVIVLVIASVLAFLVMRVIPGDPARLVMGPLASDNAVEDLRRQMGLDLPIYEQYLKYMAGLLQGDLGTAWHVRQPVSEVFATRLPASIELAFYAAIVGTLIGIPLGALTGRRPGSPFDSFGRAFSTVAVGTPSFWLGILLIIIFFGSLRVVPAPFGRLSDSVEPPPTVTGLLTVDSLLAGNLNAAADAYGHLLLPVITLAIPFAGYIARILRRGVIDVSHTDFVRTAVAKGSPPRTVLWRHVVPNAMLPVLPLLMLSIADLLAGAVLVETIFNWPGVGGFVTESITAQDFAPVQAAILLGALTYCLLNLTADLLTGWIDPRTRTT
jgi:peptide/nickel transport system permease protein